MTSLKFFLSLCIVGLFFSCADKNDDMNTETLFIGTYTNGESQGIYTLQFNPETGILDSLKLKAVLPNPSFLAISKDKKYLYAVQETADYDSLGGGISAFKLDGDNLKLLNSKGTGGAHPCHVALSDEGQLAVSNYTGGNLAVFDINEDGGLAGRQLLNHTPSDTTGVAHAHKAHFNEDGLFAADLGLDALKRYNKQPYGWIPAHQATIQLPTGAGPRHFEFNTERSFLYVINELNSTITVFQRDDEGSYNPIQTQNTLASDFEGESYCADIHLSPNGKFLYGSNRGENTIVIFTVNQESGKINLVGRESVHGDWPRNFTLTPDGNHLLVANQKSNNITVFDRNQETGELKYTNQFEIDAPVCLVFN